MIFSTKELLIPSATNSPAIIRNGKIIGLDQKIFKCLDINRLYNVVFEAGFSGALHIFFLTPTRQSYIETLSELFFQCLQYLVSVNIRKAQIEDHNFRIKFQCFWFTPNGVFIPLVDRSMNIPKLVNRLNRSFNYLNAIELESSR